MSESNHKELKSLKQILENNQQHDQEIVYKTLKSILENIIKNPNKNGHRRIDLLSDEIIKNLMPFSGALEFLFEIGFEENDDSLLLSSHIDDRQIEMFIEILDKSFGGNQSKKIKDEKKVCQTPAPIKTIAAKVMQETAETPRTPANPLIAPVAAAAAPRKLQKSPKKPNGRVNFLEMSYNHRQFYNKLENSFNHVLIYEDKNLQAKALQKIPVNLLNEKSIQNFNNYKKDTFGQKFNEETVKMEFFIIELLNWYKNEFFQWVNEPDCDNCKTKEFVRFHSNAIPTQSELAWGASRVEAYLCSQCNQETRFPRYNHPSKLLDTHKGRCGEWANCFALCLRSLGFETRYVLDWTDHVWCEIYSKSEKRWLHIDPCEACLDKPLIYEHGWGKKLTYVIAFSNQEIVDVTWRYSSKHQEVLQRRQECDEIWLVKTLNRMNKQRQRGLSNERTKELESRSVTELVEFLTPKKLKEGEDIGRQSGSLQWRLNRGEMGDSIKNINYEFKLNDNEIKSHKMNLKYNTANNQYCRESEIDRSNKDWQSLVYSYSNIQRKVEQDWQMCYLARTEGSEKAHIEWCFNFTDIKEKLKLKNLSVKCKTDCFENGKVVWSLQYNNNESFLLEKQNDEYNRIDLTGKDVSLLKLRVDLSMGKGANAFQHTQLFRQKINDYQNYLFEIDFTFD